MKIVEKIKRTLTKADAKHYIDSLGIELVIDTSEVNKELSRVDSLMHELSELGVKLHDVGRAMPARDSGFLMVGECDRGLVLVDGDGVMVPGQKNLTLKSPYDDVTTATVEFIIGGIYK